MAMPNALWSGKDIITAVSRLTGLANDTTSRAAVLDYTNLALWEITNESAWDWLVTTASDITVVAGTNTYNLPTAAGVVFDRMYDVRLVGAAERTLFPADLREWDRFSQGEQDGQSTPTHYTMFSTQIGAQVRLLPTPGAGDTLRLRYYARQIAILDVSGTGGPIAIPDNYIPMIVFKAAANVAGWKTPDRVGFWEAKYNKALSRAQDVDRVGPDDTPTLIPRIQHERGGLDWSNLTDLDVYPRG